jgi:hypothetical protein
MHTPPLQPFFAVLLWGGTARRGGESEYFGERSPTGQAKRAEIRRERESFFPARALTHTFSALIRYFKTARPPRRSRDNRAVFVIHKWGLDKSDEKN